MRQFQQLPSNISGFREYNKHIVRGIYLTDEECFSLIDILQNGNNINECGVYDPSSHTTAKNKCLKDLVDLLMERAPKCCRDILCKIRLEFNTFISNYPFDLKYADFKKIYNLFMNELSDPLLGYMINE